jgi:hypothetical protein
LYNLACELHEEFKHRRGKPHQCFLNWAEFLKIPPQNLADKGFTTPPAAMPAEIADLDEDIITKHKLFYAVDKWKFAKWSKRLPPDWFLPFLDNACRLDTTCPHHTPFCSCRSASLMQDNLKWKVINYLLSAGKKEANKTSLAIKDDKLPILEIINMICYKKDQLELNT